MKPKYKLGDLVWYDDPYTQTKIKAHILNGRYYPGDMLGPYYSIKLVKNFLITNAYESSLSDVETMSVIKKEKIPPVW